MTRPALRVGNIVIFPDGSSRPLTEDELSRLDAGEAVWAYMSSGRRTRLLREDEQ